MKIRRRRTLFYTFIITYLVVFLLPLFSGVLTYVVMGNTLSAEMMRSNMLLLEESGRSVQQTLNDVLYLGNTLTQQSDIKRYLSATAPLSAGERYHAKSVVSTLNTALQRLSLVDDFVLFVGHRDSMITTSSMYTSDLYPYYQYRIEDGIVDNWLQGVSEMKHRYFDVETGMLGANHEIPGILIAQTVPKDSVYAAPQAVLVAIIHQDSLIAQLKQNNPQGEFIVLNAKGQALASSHAELSAMDWTFTERDNHAPIHALGQDMYALRTDIREYGWRIIYLLPKTSFTSGLRVVNRVSAIAFGLSVIIGLALVILLSKKQYTPIADIIKSLDALGPNASQRAEGNEFERIHGSIRAISSRSEQLERRVHEIRNNANRMSQMLTRSQAQIQLSLLQSIMNGSIYDVDETVSWLSFYGLEFKYADFALLLLRLEGDEANAQERLRETYQTVETMLNGLYRAHFFGYLSILNEYELAVVINLPKRQGLQMVGAMAQQIQRHAADRLGFSMQYTIGGPCCDLRGLAQAYHDAKNQFDQHEQWRSASARGAAAAQYHSVAALEGQLLSALRVGSVSDVALSLRRLFTGGELSEKECKLGLMRLLLTVMEQFGQAEASNDESTEALNRYLTGESEDLDAAVNAFLDVLMGLKNTIEHQGVPKPLAEQIRCFIEDHLLDPSLSQTMIASEFGMTQSNLSKFFKKSWNLNMTDYINQARVVRSIPYLQNTKMSLTDIAAAVGFGNSKTLIRVFKKYEDTTPGQYRQ